MASKNRLTKSIWVFFFIGAVFGAVAGLVASTLLGRGPSVQVEASVLLFRVPGNQDFQAARDYLSFAISRPGFIEKFAERQGIDASTREALDNGLRVTARDPSSQNAELRLIGSDESAVTKTLDALAIYLTESLRTVDDGVKDALLQELDQEIKRARDKNLALLDSRSKLGELSAPQKKQISVASTLAGRRKELELSLRYFLKPLSDSEQQTIQQDLERITEAQALHQKRISRVPPPDLQQYRFETEVALSDAEIRALTQAKQRLVIEYNKDTPFRIASRAKAAPLLIEGKSFYGLIGVCAFVGLLIGGMVWSVLRTRESKLTGLQIEKKLGVPTIAVISQQLTDQGEQQGMPLVLSDSQSEELVGIRSLNVALHFLKEQREQSFPIVISELDTDEHVAHVIANLALDMVNHQSRVLVIESSSEPTTLSALFEDGIKQAWVEKLSVDDFSAGITATTVNENKIYYVQEKGTDLGLGPIALFDSILVHAKDASVAKKRLATYSTGVGLVLCTAQSRVSKLRNAVGRRFGKKLHGAVICGYASS